MPGLLLRRLTQASASLLAEEMHRRGYNLTAAECAALQTINDHPGLDARRLADHVAFDRADTKSAVERIAHAKLIRSVGEGDDLSLFVTNTGSDLLQQVRPILRDMQVLLMDGLNEDEQAAFVRMLRKATRVMPDQSRD
ncbi:MarR family winged helix-turn-helix transcriptional regulator [Rhizobium halophytocola]|uniref:DNA-binding MarR family transcriptional regulator n=1 Tax=Rhizobium halophytocola TaxID=735519 RepID=A0ABS4E2I6_9HYPH|nr:MarR family winged helix-turn-helix transcriptional regulator [Rhizobium halophytocola]MBP1852151.1 DNA-binding MarR family transcriptional regulator [Rhizobium halophytocola]